MERGKAICRLFDPLWRAVDEKYKINHVEKNRRWPKTIFTMKGERKEGKKKTWTFTYKINQEKNEINSIKATKSIHKNFCLVRNIFFFFIFKIRFSIHWKQSNNTIFIKYNFLIGDGSTPKFCSTFELLLDNGELVGGGEKKK